MLESQWAAALASNNVRAVIRWLRRLTAEGDARVEEILTTFSCWVQRTSEFAKKELMTLCFSRCQGLWMFLDKSSFTRVHMLLQRLGNLLTLAQWARKQLASAHLWHGVGVPCAVCRDTRGSSAVRRGCWNQAHADLRRHIWLGRLVQWWGTTGLLPKHPEAHEVKHISQMWKEMDHSHRRSPLETPGCEEVAVEGSSSFIQCLVTQLQKQHGCVWAAEDCTEQRYPPPDLQALLRLVLAPHIDDMSVQAILMYFILDMANFLQCKDDLLQSFCHAFTIPSAFSQQIRALWMLDHGHVVASMELLLSPRASVPRLSWQHRCILHRLLARRQPWLALRYLHWTTPATESSEDAKLCADVLLHNRRVSDAWTVLKKGHADSEDMVEYFLQACEGFGLRAEALRYVTVGHNVGGDENADSQQPSTRKGRPPCPLSARLYQAQKANAVSPEELVELVSEAVMEVREAHPRKSEAPRPEPTERESNSSTTFRASPVDMAGGTEHTAHAVKQPVFHDQQLETQGYVPSSAAEDLSSECVSSFTSASLPLLRRDRPRVHRSTSSLRRILSLLADVEDQSREEEEGEEEESGTPSSVDVLLNYPELAVTLGGATAPLTLSQLNKDLLLELMLSGEEHEWCEIPGIPGSSIKTDLPLNANEVSQSVLSLFESQSESHAFLSPEYEKTAVLEDKVHGLPNVSALWGSVVSLNQDDQSDYIPPQIFSFSGAAESDCFHQETCCSRGFHDIVDQSEIRTSCAMFGTAQDLLSDLHHRLESEEGAACVLEASAGICELGCSLLLPVSTLCNTHTSSSPRYTKHEIVLEAKSNMDKACVHGASDHWKQDLETQEASTEPGAAIKSDETPSFVLDQPYSRHVVTAKQKADGRRGKQADKEELAGWRVSQGAMRSERRRGKRVKRA